MKFPLFASLATAWMLFAVSTAAQASIYNLKYDGSVYDVDAWVTTDNLDNAIAISGQMTGPNGTVSIQSLIPTSSPDYHNLWIWNNRFTAAAPHVDYYGLLWAAADGSLANYYLDAGRLILSVANPITNTYTNWANGDVGTAAVTAVPIPAAFLSFGSSLLGIGFLGRARRRLGKHG